MYESTKSLLLVIASTFIGLLICEIYLRLFEILPPELPALITEPRLYEPKLTSTFDIEGLYENARSVQFSTSARQLIEPDSGNTDRKTVLFVGGSTTESLYVPERNRWTALLNNQDRQTLNAGRSGSTVFDSLNSILTLQDHNVHFNTVVVMTTINDFAWLHRARLMNTEFSYTTQSKARNSWEYFASGVGDQEAKRNAQLYSWSRLGGIVGVFLNKFEPKEVDASRFLPSLSGDSVGQLYISQRRYFDEQTNHKDISVSNCHELKELENSFRTLTMESFQRLQNISKERGYKVIIMSEASSYKSGSNLVGGVDIRIPIPCNEKDSLSYAASSEALHLLNSARLAIAKNFGFDTIDLEQLIEAKAEVLQKPLMYDSVHFNEFGSRQVALILDEELSKRR